MNLKERSEDYRIGYRSGYEKGYFRLKRVMLISIVSILCPKCRRKFIRDNFNKEVIA